MPFRLSRLSVAAAGSAAFMILCGSLPGLAQNPDKSAEHTWSKDYNLTGSPTLTIETGDSNLDIRSCGECKEIRIRVRSVKDLSGYNLEEHQDQDRVYFTLKEKPHYFRFDIRWKNSDQPQVSVETPAKLTLEAKTADGSFAAHHLTGSLQVRSGDGAVVLDDVHGDLHMNSSDGSLNIHDATGTLEARTSDGHMKVEGQFSAVQLHTSDGGLEFALSPGSQLTASSRIESSDGHVWIKLPHDLAADLDVSTSDGRLDCTLPVTLDGYKSGGSSHHQLHGRLNAGGASLIIHTSDGDVSITAI